MRAIILAMFLPFLIAASGDMISESKYKRVNGSTTDVTGGITLSNGVTYAVQRFIATGVDPSVNVSLIYCYGTGSERVFSSTKGDVNVVFDERLATSQVTGNGTCKLQVIIINTALSQSSYVGGFFEAKEL